MIKDICDKTSKISLSVYKTDFIQYFGEYKEIIRELGTEINTRFGAQRR